MNFIPPISPVTNKNEGKYTVPWFNYLKEAPIKSCVYQYSSKYI